MENLKIENATIMFRNFAGKADRFNAAGNRNFCVRLDEDIAVKLADDGWNVKPLRKRDEDDDQMYRLQVAVRFDILPPHVYMVCGKNTVPLNEDTIDQLDWAEITNVDLSIRPRQWEMNGQTGVKAYLHTMYVTIEEDPFASKYSPMEDPDLPF